MKNFLFLFSFGFFGLLGCATAEQCARKFPAQIVTKNVLVYDTLVVRDSTIIIESDSIIGFIPCPDPSPYVAGTKGGGMAINVRPTSGGYIVDCSSQLKNLKVKLYDRIRSTYESNSESRTHTVARMNKFQSTFFWIGISLVIYFIVKLGLVIISKVYPPASWLSFILRFLP